MNEQRVHEHTCTPCACVVADHDVNWCQKVSGAQDTGLVHATLTAKNAHTPMQARPCNDAATCSPCKSLRPIFQLVHASPGRSRSCVVTQASSDHPRWCGPHTACLRFAHPISADHIIDKIVFPTLFGGLCNCHKVQPYIISRSE